MTPRVESHLRHRTARTLSATALVFVAVTSCGAEGVAPPPVPIVHQNSSCPTTEEALVNTRAALHDGPLAQIGPYIEQILIDDGGLRVLLPVALTVLHEVPLASALDLLEGWQENEGLARLVPHLILVLDYIIGESAFVAGEHYEVIDVLHNMLNEDGRSCDNVSVLSATRRLLTIRVVQEDGTEVPWIEPFFDAVVQLAQDEAFVGVLGDIEFDENGTGGIAVGRDAFILISRLLTENLAADNLDLDYVRSLVDDLLVLQIPDDQTGARAKLTTLLDQLEVIVDPSSEIFPYVQGLIRCGNEVDDEGALPGMLYDYFSIDELSLVEFFQDVDAMGASPAGTSLRILLEDAIPILEQDRQLTSDAMRVLNRFFAPTASRELLPGARHLQGAGVLTELVNVSRRFTNGCGTEAP